MGGIILYLTLPYLRHPATLGKAESLLMPQALRAAPPLLWP